MPELQILSREKVATRLFPRVGRLDPSGGWSGGCQKNRESVIALCLPSLPLFQWVASPPALEPLSKSFQPAVAHQTKS